MATPNLGFQNWYSSTLSSGITASDTTIYLNSLPTPSEGYLVLEPDSTTNREIIYYTSKGANFVTLPSAAAGRGVGGTTAVSHSSGVTVQMNVVAEHFEALQDGTAINADTLALSQINGSDEFFPYDFVASGCIWTGDAYGSTRLASMTAGVVYINGVRVSVSAVTARAFTASKDTYVDVDDSGTISYTEVANNAASPSLSANSIRIAIIVTGGSSIANVGAINQGQPGKLLPVASSNYYMVCDSLGNRICPRNPSGGLLGMRAIYANDTTGGTAEADVTGLNLLPLIADGVSTYRIEAHINAYNSSGAAFHIIRIKEGSTTYSIGNANMTAINTVNLTTPYVDIVPTAGTHTYKISQQASGGNKNIEASSSEPATISVRRV